jgi:hypothetical protein
VRAAVAEQSTDSLSVRSITFEGFLREVVTFGSWQLSFGANVHTLWLIEVCLTNRCLGFPEKQWLWGYCPALW